MTDHHDFGDHHFDDDPLPFDDHSPLDHAALEQPWDPPDDHHLHDDLPETHEPAYVPDHDDTPVPVEAEHDMAAATDLPEVTEDPVDVFPPAVDVGDLPEPVDGFPWIDSGSLGLADIAAALHEADTTEAVQPHELAEYAAADLPPGVDPWAALADSDDPATSALARWWSQN